MDLNNQKDVEIGGRVFVPTPEDEIVFEQFVYTQKAAEDAGLGDELVEAYKPFIEEVDGERKELSDDELAKISKKVLFRAFEGRAYLRVLAGVLVEKGEEWSLETAEANEEFFRRAKGGDISKLHAVLVMATIGFFTAALGSSTTSRSSLARKARLEAQGVDLSKVTMRPRKSVSPVTPLDGAEPMETTPK